MQNKAVIEEWNKKDIRHIEKEQKMADYNPILTVHNIS